MSTSPALTIKSNRPIGFIIPIHSPKQDAVINPAEQMLIFDGGRGISFLEGSHNIGIFGGTGRGKTTSIVLPKADRLLAAGFGGLIIDVKNNMTDQIRSLSHLHGRATDVVELGNFPTATPCNLLSGLTITGITNLLSRLALSGIEQTSNLDWHQKGIGIASDCAQLALFLSEFEDVKLNFDLLQEMLNDYDLSQRMMRHFKNNHFNKDREDHLRFVRRLRNVCFHVFSSTHTKDYEQQMSWNLQRIRGTLAQLSEDATLWRNINIGSTLDIADLIYKQKKVIALRFRPDTSAIGNMIARVLKERYYQAVYENGLSMLEKNHYTFAIMDEFQDIMDVDGDSNLNDFAWFAKSREFSNINIIATQSISSLFGRSHNRDAVVSLLNNCSTKIILQLDDPTTLEWMARYDIPIRPQNLTFGHALVLKYDLGDRAYTITEESLQNSHDITKRKLTQVMGLSICPQPEQQIDNLQPLQLELFDEPTVHDEHPAPEPVTQSIHISREQERLKQITEELAEWPALHNFLQRFSRSISHRISKEDCAIPPGWLPLATDAMEQAEQLQVPFTTTFFGMTSGEMIITTNNRNSPADAIFKEVQQKSFNICIFCGKRMKRKRPKKEENSPFFHNERIKPPICRDCKQQSTPKKQ